MPTMINTWQSLPGVTMAHPSWRRATAGSSSPPFHWAGAFQTVPGTAGTSAPLENVGKVNNKGWELSLTYRTNTGSVGHAFSFNLSDNLNKVIRFGQESVRGSDYSYIIKEGFPIASYYGYK